MLLSAKIMTIRKLNDGKVLLVFTNVSFKWGGTVRDLLTHCSELLGSKVKAWVTQRPGKEQSVHATSAPGVLVSK